MDVMPGTAGESESDGAVLARLGTDGEKWAAEFCRVGWNEGGRQFLGELEPGGGGFLHGWLCNAIEAGRSAGYYQGYRRGLADRAESLALGLAPAAVARLSGAHFPVQPPVVADRTSELPENLAGSYEFPRVMERIAEALEKLASTVSPTTAYGWAAPSIRTDPAR